MDKVWINVWAPDTEGGFQRAEQAGGLVYAGAHLDGFGRIYLAVDRIPGLIRAGYIDPCDLGYGSLCLLVRAGGSVWREEWFVWLSPSGMQKYFPTLADGAELHAPLPEMEVASADLPF